jgi:hypothetical protein
MEVVDPNTGIPLSEMPPPANARGGAVADKRKRKKHKLAVMGTTSDVSACGRGGRRPTSPHRTSHHCVALATERAAVTSVQHRPIMQLAVTTMEHRPVVKIVIPPFCCTCGCNLSAHTCVIEMIIEPAGDE